VEKLMLAIEDGNIQRIRSKTLEATDFEDTAIQEEE
jgi:hypothetical protein